MLLRRREPLRLTPLLPKKHRPRQKLKKLQEQRLLKKPRFKPKHRLPQLLRKRLLRTLYLKPKEKKLKLRLLLMQN